VKRFAILTTVFTAVLTLVLPFVGGGGPGLVSSATAANSSATGLPRFASPTSVPAVASAPNGTSAHVNEAVLASTVAQRTAALGVDTEHLAQKPVPKPVVVEPPAAGKSSSGGGSRGGGGGGAVSTAQRRAAVQAAGGSCPTGGGGGGSAPGRTSAGGVAGTTSGDISSFAATYNSIRIANCLQPIPASNFRYDSCMETRLFWMAEDPSTDPMSAWGHIGSQRSDGVPSVGCDGNLAGGSGNSGATVAQKWWDSLPHRASLYKPTFSGSTAGVCIYFAMTHGGLPSEPYGFTRAAARWGSC
jgi:hypothetical protein